MAGVTGSFALTVDLKQIRDADLSNPVDELKFTRRWSFTPGTNNGQADIQFHDTRTLAASATENLDLAGVLANAFGNTVTMAEVVALYIEASAANTNDVLIGPAASNGFLGPFNAAADRLKIAPGKGMMIQAPAAGWPVTAGTGDLLFVGNGGAGTPVTYTILIVARTV